MLCRERATAWLFHVGASQNYVESLSSRKIDGGLTMKCRVLKDKPNIRAVGKGHLMSAGGTSIFDVIRI